MSEHVLNQYISKIEGHGCLNYSHKDGKVTVRIDEGERLFEKLVIGQHYKDIAFITARICGVCPTSHVMAATLAAENAFGVQVNDSITNLRRALQAAQIVQSHVLHDFFLALPDYLGVKGGLELHDKNPRIFKLASSLKGIADEVTEVVGGRAVHPVSPTVGGFLSVPEPKEVEALIAKVKSSQRLALETLEMFAGFRYPALKNPTEYFALTKDGKIDVFGDTLVSSKDVEVAASDYRYVITEKVKPHSSAKYAEHNGGPLMVGAIARVNMMETEDFHPKTQKALASLSIKLPILNSFKNNLAQAVEILNFLEEIEISLTNYLFGKKERHKVGYRVKAGTGVGAVEAPRGTLYHMYEFDKDGYVTDCDIITPTVQNLTNLESDANAYLKQNKSVTIPRREKELEKLVRAYDPCITCSVH
jgi:sulfhydrogenase subunit alpha